MPPSIALLLCTIFVILLLRLERKQTPDVSHSLWIPVIWMLLNCSKPLGVWFGVGSPDIEAGSPLDRAFLTALLCLSGFILAKRKFDLSRALSENIWVVIILGYMLISILWSDIPIISFKRWVRELVAVVMALLVLSEQNPRQALQSIFRRIIYILIPFSLLLIKYYPSYGIEYGRWSGMRMWVGVALQKNGLGRLCILSTLFLVWTLIRRRQGRDIPVTKYQIHAELFLLLLTLYLLAGPQRTYQYSATSTVSLAVGLSALLSLIMIKKRRLIIGFNAIKVILVSVIAYGTFTPLVGRLSFLDIAPILGRDETLTGRTGIWAILVPFALKRPVLGHGIGGFWTTAMRDLTSSHAHNGYLEVLLSLGFVGLLLVSIFVLSCFHKAKSALAYDVDWGILFISFLLMVVVHNIAEPSIDALTSPLLALVLFFSIASPRVARIDNKLGDAIYGPS